MKYCIVFSLLCLLFGLLMPRGAHAAIKSNATDTSCWTQETSSIASHGYVLGAGVIDLFSSHVMETGNPVIGAMDYYLYNPIEHGADPNGEYPLLVMFHGANNGGKNNKTCGALTDWMIYASTDYQEKLAGSYILFPKANEYTSPHTAVIHGISHTYCNTGTWMTQVDGTSVYSQALADLVTKLCAEYSIRRVYVMGTSAGGYMAWRFAIDHPELCDKVVAVAPAYTPTLKELQALGEHHIGIWVIHGLQDSNCPILTFTGPIVDQLEQMPEARISILDVVRFGDKRIVSVISNGKDIGQHLAQFAVGQNMLYADGTAYDVRYPDGLIAWLINENHVDVK